MADLFIATEGVKVVKDSASLWPQIITAVSSVGAALGGVSLTHHYTIPASVRKEQVLRKWKVNASLSPPSWFLCWNAMLLDGYTYAGMISVHLAGVKDSLCGTFLQQAATGVF